MALKQHIGASKLQLHLWKNYWIQKAPAPSLENNWNQKTQAPGTKKVSLKLQIQLGI